MDRHLFQNFPFRPHRVRERDLVEADVAANLVQPLRSTNCRQRLGGKCHHPLHGSEGLHGRGPIFGKAHGPVHNYVQVQDVLCQQLTSHSSMRAHREQPSRDKRDHAHERGEKTVRRGENAQSGTTCHLDVKDLVVFSYVKFHMTCFSIQCTDRRQQPESLVSYSIQLGQLVLGLPRGRSVHAPVPLRAARQNTKHDRHVERHERRKMCECPETTDHRGGGAEEEVQDVVQKREHRLAICREPGG
mmetsp:Transcript_154963/g.496630  ORF Transcript_154963/g.496630 Transcript_154963/m.496630 type:complete len:245 (-) Transcript_154963:2252-2986(-)